MAGGASANPSSPSSTPVSTVGGTTSAYTPQFVTLPTAPKSTTPGAIYSMGSASHPGFAQQGSPYQSFASRMPTSISGYGNFSQAPTSVKTGPTADQVRAQMLAYQQQYQPGMQQAQKEVANFEQTLRAAEEARKAEIARKAAEAAAAEAERQRQTSMWWAGRGESDQSAYGPGSTGTQGGLASLQGFER